MPYRIDTYEIETHPFGSFIPTDAHTLIVGTFPTYKDNYKNTFNFFYGGKDNLFWSIITGVFGHSFKFDCGEAAIKERKEVLERNGIGITDMHETCYRRNRLSGDENLFVIRLLDVFSTIDKNANLNKLVLTSRTPVFGALGLLHTYFLQKGLQLNKPSADENKVLHGNFEFGKRNIKIIIPYSPSPRLMRDQKTTLKELIEMYRNCFISNR
jgi:G:T/U-mismatch repair DNA glycosylase